MHWQTVKLVSMLILILVSGAALIWASGPHDLR